MARQDVNEALAQTSFLYRRQRRLHRGPLRPVRQGPELGRCRVAGVLRRAEGRRPVVDEERQGRLVDTSRTGRSPPTANWSRRSTATGPRSSRRSATRSRRKAQAKGAEVTRPRCCRRPATSVRAIMLIRAYRMRGHLHANLDPLGTRAARRPRGTASVPLRLHRGRSGTARSSSTTCSAWSSRTIREIVAILERTYCQTLGVEFMHISDPGREGLDPGAHRGAGQGDRLHARGQARDPQQAGRGRGLREVPRPEVHRHQALRPRRRRGDDPGAGADHQARRRARREGDRARHGPSRPPQRAGAGDGQAPPRDLPRVQGRLVHAGRRRGLGRREIPPRRLVGPHLRRQQRPPVADRQSLAPGDRRSGGARQGARQAGPARATSSSAPR